MMKHICKICDYEAEQPTHHKDHLKSNIHIMTFAKRLLEVREMRVPDLRKLHKEEGLTGYSRLKKQELINNYMINTMKKMKIRN